MYSDTLQCVIFHLSQWRVNSYDLLCDTIFWTNLYLGEEVTTMYIRWLSVDVNTVTALIPPSTLVVSCTVKITVFIISSREFHGKLIMSTCSSKTLQQSVDTVHWHFLHWTDCSGGRTRSCHSFENPLSSLIHHYQLRNELFLVHTKTQYRGLQILPHSQSSSYQNSLNYPSYFSVWQSSLHQHWSYHSKHQ